MAEVPDHIVLALRRALWGARRRAAANGSELPADVAGVIAALDAIQTAPMPVAAVDPPGSDIAGSSSLVGGADGSSFPSAVGVCDVARRTGSRESWGRRAAARGTLRGRKVHGVWRFGIRDAERWEERLVATATRRAETAARGAQAEAEQAMRTELATAESQLRDLDEQLRALEAARDGAQARLAAYAGRGGVDEWRAQTDLDAAEASIAALRPRVESLRRRISQLRVYIAPIDAARGERDRLVRELDWLRGLRSCRDEYEALAARMAALPRPAGERLPKIFDAMVRASAGSSWASLDYRLSDADSLAERLARPEKEA